MSFGESKFQRFVSFYFSHDNNEEVGGGGFAQNMVRTPTKLTFFRNFNMNDFFQRTL
jgi:hypothetical protein